MREEEVDRSNRDNAGAAALPRAILSFACFTVALRLDEGVNGSLQQLLTETAVQLGDGVSWREKANYLNHS